MADISLQQQSGLGDLSRTIVPKAGLALEPVFNAAERVHKETTADFEAQQMEKVKVKTIAAQNALNLIAEERARKGVAPLRVQAVVGGDTFANREFLKTAQEISRTMTIDQVHSDLQGELIQLRTDYLTKKGQLDYDPNNPSQDNAARYSAQAFEILKKYHVAYAESPFVDDVFDAQMTAKFTGTVNTFVKEIRETQATKVVADYQIRTLDELQQLTAEWDDAALAEGFASSDNFAEAHKAWIEPRVLKQKELLYRLKDSGASDQVMMQAILATHDDRTQQFKNGVMLSITTKYKDDPVKLVAKINEFAAYINKGGAFYENQMMKTEEMDSRDFGGYLANITDDLFKRNIEQGGEVFTEAAPSEAAYKAMFESLIGTVKDPGQKDTLIRKYNTTLKELERSRLRGEGRGAERRALLKQMQAKDEKGALIGNTYYAWDNEMDANEKALVPDVEDPAAIGVLDTKDGDQKPSNAQLHLMERVSDALENDNPYMLSVVEATNKDRAAAGLQPFNVNTQEGRSAFARAVADESIGVYMADFAAKNRQRALREFEDKPSVVLTHSALPNDTYADLSKSLHEAANDEAEFNRQAMIAARVFKSVNGPHNLDSDFERLNEKENEFGVGSLLKVANNVGSIAGLASQQDVQSWWASGEGIALDDETEAELKILKSAAIISDYTGELEVIGAGPAGTQGQKAFVERMLKGAYLQQLQGVRGGGPTGDAQREVVDPSKALADAEKDVGRVLEDIRKTTALSANQGAGGRVWNLPPMIRASEPDVKALSYILTPVATNTTQMARDFPDAYGGVDLTQYKPVVVDNKVRIRRIRPSNYEPLDLLWLPNGTPTDTTKFTPPGSKLRLIQPVTGKPVEYSLEGFAEEIEKEKKKQWGTTVTGGEHWPTNVSVDPESMLRAMSVAP